MPVSRQKLVLTDCDGVLLNWNGAFSDWMTLNGHRIQDTVTYDISKRYGIGSNHAARLVTQFNDTGAHIEGLMPWLDAVKWVRKLHFEQGYRFVVISSVSDSPASAILRRRNLYRVFGPEPFDSIVCLPIGADKSDALRPYADSVLHWVEDSFKNAMDGYRLGLRSLLFDAPYNSKDVPPFPRVSSWGEIYNTIIDNEARIKKKAA